MRDLRFPFLSNLSSDFCESARLKIPAVDLLTDRLLWTLKIAHVHVMHGVTGRPNA
jgi:hypothetical protein